MWPTIIIASVVGLIFLSIIFVGIRNKRKGKSSCSCGGCGGCGMSSFCHSKQQDDQKGQV